MKQLSFIKYFTCNHFFQFFRYYLRVYHAAFHITMDCCFRAYIKWSLLLLHS